MGWPAKKSEKEAKEEELASLKKKVAALEKELRVRFPALLSRHMERSYQAQHAPNVSHPTLSPYVAGHIFEGEHTGCFLEKQGLKL